MPYETSLAASSTNLYKRLSPGKKPGVQLKSPYDDQANSDSINHATFEIFSNTGFQFSTRQRKRERERKEREKVHYREKDFNVFNTHYSPRLASVRPPSTPICHSQRAYDAAIWKTEIIRGGGGAGDKAGWGWWVRTKGSKRWSEVQWFRKEVQCSAWIHLEYYYSTLIWLFWSCGPDMAVIYRAL